jgi:hypothetical protein
MRDCADRVGLNKVELIISPEISKQLLTKPQEHKA